MNQATSFSLEGWLLPKPGSKGCMWPIYRATVFNSDGSVLDFREEYNDFELAFWLESFGFLRGDEYIAASLA